jgi:hypothetical protein
VQNQWGRPDVVYSERGEKMRRKLGIGGGYITLTDEAGLIVAVCVLEAAEKKAERRSKARPKSKPKPRAKVKPRAKSRRVRR